MAAAHTVVITRVSTWGAATKHDPPGFDLHALELGGTELFANMAFGEGFMLLGYLQRDAGDPKSEVG